MLDDGDFDAGGLEADQALVGVAQQRRGKALNQLFGMGIEGDHRRPRSRAQCRAAQFAKQVQMAAVQAVEDADRHVQPAEARVERADAGYDGHAVAGAVDAQALLHRLRGPGRRTITSFGTVVAGRARRSRQGRNRRSRRGCRSSAGAAGASA